MAKKSLIEDNKDMAFRAYCTNGGNLKETSAALKRQGLEISTRSLQDWAEKYNFSQRLREADATIAALELPKAQRLLLLLMKQLDKYERLIEQDGLTDPQVMYAMLSVVKTIAAFEGVSFGRTKPTPEDEHKTAEDIFAQHYGLRNLGHITVQEPFLPAPPDDLTHPESEETVEEPAAVIAAAPPDGRVGPTQAATRSFGGVVEPRGRGWWRQGSGAF